MTTTLCRRRLSPAAGMPDEGVASPRPARLMVFAPSGAPTVRDTVVLVDAASSFGYRSTTHRSRSVPLPARR